MFTTNEQNLGTGQPLLIDGKSVAAMLGRSERSVYRDDIAGRIPRPVMIGGSKHWNLEDLRRWVAAGCLSRADWEKHSGRAVDHEANGSNGGA